LPVFSAFFSLACLFSLRNKPIVGSETGSTPISGLPHRTIEVRALGMLELREQCLCVVAKLVRFV
jgi:hypothetical protein